MILDDVLPTFTVAVVFFPFTILSVRMDEKNGMENHRSEPEQSSNMALDESFWEKVNSRIFKRGESSPRRDVRDTAYSQPQEGIRATPLQVFNVSGYPASIQKLRHEC